MSADHFKQMNDAVVRINSLISQGHLFTADDAKQLQRTIEWFAQYRNHSIRYSAMQNVSHAELATTWNLTPARISQIVNSLPEDEVPEVPYQPRVLDYLGLLHAPDLDNKDVAETFQRMRVFSRELQKSFTPKTPIVAWSIGNPEIGYEFIYEYPGDEAMATGEIETWTAEQLCEQLNDAHKNKPMVAFGAAASDPEPEPEPGTKVWRFAAKDKADNAAARDTAQKVGAKFKALRKKARMNQTRAGKLIGESQMFVSMLERGRVPNRKLVPSGMQLALVEFEQNLKTLLLI